MIHWSTQHKQCGPRPTLVTVSALPHSLSISDYHGDAQHYGLYLSVPGDDWQGWNSVQVLARTYFYKSSKLVARGLIKVRVGSSYARGGGDLMDHQVELDRRMLDWIVGLDTEMNELVEGSHLYTPKVFCLPWSPTTEQLNYPNIWRKHWA
jgi:hypothetical protein